MKNKKQKSIHIADLGLSSFHFTQKGTPYSLFKNSSTYTVILQGRFKTEISRREINHLIKDTGFLLQRAENIQFATSKKRHLEERIEQLTNWIDESGLIELTDVCPFCLESGCDAIAPTGKEFGKVHHQCYKEALHAMEESQNQSSLKPFLFSSFLCILTTALFLLLFVLFDIKPAVLFYFIPYLFCYYYLNKGGNAGKTALILTINTSLLCLMVYVVGLYVIHALRYQDLVNLQFIIEVIIFNFSLTGLEIFFFELIFIVLGMISNPLRIAYRLEPFQSVMKHMKQAVRINASDDRFNYLDEKFSEPQK